MVVGATKKMRIATAATDTNEAYVSSVKGMTLTPGATVTAEGAFADNGSQAGSTYNGYRWHDYTALATTSP